MFLSVITPCRNAEKTIERCIESVLSPRIEGVEQVVVDGLSTDNTVKLLETLKQKYPDTLHFISEKDKSMTDAMLKAVKLTKGTYLSPLNADDFYITKNLYALLNYFKANQPEILFANSIIVNPDGSFKFRTRPKYPNSKLVWNLLGCVTPETGFFISKETYDKAGGYDDSFRFCQDYDFYLRAINVGNADYLNLDIGGFQLSDEQFSNTMHFEMREEFTRSSSFGGFAGFLQHYRIDKLFRAIIGTQDYSNPVQGDIYEYSKIKHG